MRAVIGAALLNKAVRNAFIALLTKSVSWALRYAKRSGFSVPAALSALAALLLAMMRGRDASPRASSKRQKDQIIDLDEFTILDDRL